ncbi:MAG TPA: DUF2231 domain-containing protein [Micromonosporaceae bacterium]
MRSQARALGHAVHPMLIVFPLGLLATAVVFDLLYLLTNRQGFTVAAGYTIAAGIIGGLLAGVFGLVDWLAIPEGTRARRIGILHGLGNVLVLVLFVASWLLRMNSGDWTPSAAALTLSFIGVVVSGITGWLGGELVERLGVSVDEDAGLNASSSLSRSAARQSRQRTVPGTR